MPRAEQSIDARFFHTVGRLIPLLNIQLGEVVFGGVGAGLYGMLVYVVVAVFIAGLMVGRTPEFLGKKIEPYDVKMASFVILILAFSLLGFSGWAAISKWGPVGADGTLSDGTNNSGPHGFAEILYAYSSATGTTAAPLRASLRIRLGITPRWASRCCSGASP